MFGKRDKDADAETARIVEKESRRGAKEAAALRLEAAEREYEKNPSKINAAALNQARRNL